MTAERVETKHVPTGLHHVTGIAGDAQRTVEFYAGVLGLDLHCRTANFEDVLVPHLYYGDRDGSLGSILTFFAFGETDPGRVGPPQPTVVGLSVPRGSIPFWRDRFDAREISFDGPSERFGERVLQFADFDGTRLELVAAGDDSDSGSEPRSSATNHESRSTESARDDGVSHSVHSRRIHGVTLQSVNPYATAALLETFDFERAGQAGDRVRYRAADGTAVNILDRKGDFGREGPERYTTSRFVSAIATH